MTDGYVLVTGASSGIGAEIARVAASDGRPVALTARREERLEGIADELGDEHGVDTLVLPKDLSRPDAPRELRDEIRDEGVDVHTLVNNAGFGVYGGFDETDEDQEFDMLAVNVTALTRLTKLFLPPMVERGDGGVVNAGSIVSYYPAPGMAVYGATKAYVLWLSRALAHEFEDDGVTVTAYCPGPVETEFMEKGGVDEASVDDGITITPRAVAEAVWDGYTSGDRIVFPTLSTAFFARMGRLLPHRTATSLGEDGIEEGVSYLPL